MIGSSQSFGTPVRLQLARRWLDELIKRSARNLADNLPPPLAFATCWVHVAGWDCSATNPRIIDNLSVARLGLSILRSDACLTSAGRGSTCEEPAEPPRATGSEIWAALLRWSGGSGVGGLPLA